MTSLHLMLLALTMAACQASPAALPPVDDSGPGGGLVRVDEAPPAGAETWPRPTWRVGDSFTLVRGEKMRGTYEVVAAADGVYSIADGSGDVLRRDFDLGNLGKWSADGEQPVRVMSPVDVRYHWPLWVGKRWQCQFVDRMPDGTTLTMQADYEVEGMDTIEVPAGEFQALRIVRTVRLIAEGNFLTRTQLTWYAPDEGLEVRQLLSDTMVELVAVERGATDEGDSSPGDRAGR